MTALLLALTQIVVVGLPAALLLDRDDSPSRARLLGEAFLLGSGIVWLVLFTLSGLGLGWSRLSVTVALLVVAISLWIPARKVVREAGPPEARATWIDLGTLIVLGAHAFVAAEKPVRHGDFWAIWGLKARVFFEHGSIDWAFLLGPFNWYQHSDYPLLLPFNYLLVALHEGGWSDRWMGPVTTLYAVALALIVRDLFARELPRHVAALATLGVAAVGASPWIGLADAPMVAYGTAGLLLMRRRVTPLSAILLGLAACSKNEGLLLIAVVVLVLVLVGRVREVVSLWPAVALSVPWLALRAWHRLEGDLLPSAFDLDRVGPILRGIAQEPPARPLLWVGLAAALVLLVGSLRRERFVLLTCLFQGLAYVAVYLISPHDVSWHIVYSWPRLLEHVTVPLVFATLLIAGSTATTGK